MSQFLTNVGLLAGQNHFLAYFIVYIAVIVLGNLSAFAAFWIVFHGFFGSWGLPLLILTIFLADITGDLLWFSLGSTLRDTRAGNFIKNHLPHHEKIEAKIHKSGTKLIFMSKFIYASALPVLFCFGWFKTDFKKFFKASILSILLWLPVLTLLAFGLFSGLAPLYAIKIFKNFEITFLIGLALFILVDYFIARLFKKIFGNGNGNGRNVNTDIKNGATSTEK